MKRTPRSEASNCRRLRSYSAAVVRFFVFLASETKCSIAALTVVRWEFFEFSYSLTVKPSATASRSVPAQRILYGLLPRFHTVGSKQTSPRRPDSARGTWHPRFGANARLSGPPDSASLSQPLFAEYRFLPRPDCGKAVASRKIMHFYWVFWGWGGRRGLNPRHSVPQTDALPAELLPPLMTGNSLRYFFHAQKGAPRAITFTLIGGKKWNGSPAHAMLHRVLRSQSRVLVLPFSVGLYSVSSCLQLASVRLRAAKPRSQSIPALCHRLREPAGSVYLSESGIAQTLQLAEVPDAFRP